MDKKNFGSPANSGTITNYNQKTTRGNARIANLKKIDRLNRKLNFYSSLKINELKICENSTYDILFCKIKHRS